MLDICTVARRIGLPVSAAVTRPLNLVVGLFEGSRWTPLMLWSRSNPATIEGAVRNRRSFRSDVSVASES
jgi:hypothetical protein